MDCSLFFETGNCSLIATELYKCSGNFTEDVTYSKIVFFLLNSLAKCFRHVKPHLLLLLMASLVPVLVLSLYSYCHYTILKVQIESSPTCIKNSGVQEFDFSQVWASEYFCTLSCADCDEKLSSPLPIEYIRKTLPSYRKLETL